MKQSMIGSVPGNILGMLSDLAQKLQHGARTPEELALFLQGKNPFATQSDVLADWQRFYLKHFGTELDCSGLVLPKKRNGFDRIIVIAQGLTIDGAIEACRKRFLVWTYVNNLDGSVTENDRMPTKTYAIRLRDRQEADEELKSLSAISLQERRVPGVTLIERVIYELKYWDETGSHLDIYNWTLCNGSRHSDGNVPDAHWYVSKFYVLHCSAGLAYPRLRSREAVS